MKPYCVSIRMKAIEQFFYVILFILLYKVVLTFMSVDETLVRDHSNESYWAVLSCRTVLRMHKVTLIQSNLSVKLYSVTREETHTTLHS